MVENELCMGQMDFGLARRRSTSHMSDLSEYIVPKGNPNDFEWNEI